MNRYVGEVRFREVVGSKCLVGRRYLTKVTVRLQTCIDLPKPQILLSYVSYRLFDFFSFIPLRDGHRVLCLLYLFSYSLEFSAFP